MTNTTTGIDVPGGYRPDGSLRAPRRGARWRWSSPHRAQAPSGSPPVPANAGRMVGGRVAAVHGDTLVVEGRGGAIRVVETAWTRYTTLSRGRSSAAPGPAAVRVGDFVGVRGTATKDGTVAATSVTVFTAPPFGSAFESAFESAFGPASGPASDPT